MTKIWAHRGASQDAPENTMEAFELAIKQHADGIETDIHLTKDGQVVIMHDEKLDRTTNMHGYIKDYNYEELEKCNANNGMKDYPFCKVPLLEDLLQLVKTEHIELNIELKTDVFMYPGIEAKCLALVKKYELENQVIYSSFNHYSLMNLRQLDPQAKIGLLYTEGLVNPWDYAQTLNANALHPYFPNLKVPSYVKESHELKVMVNPWTVNRREDIMEMMALNVDCVITNVPALALKVRKEMLCV